MSSRQDVQARSQSYRRARSQPRNDWIAQLRSTLTADSQFARLELVEVAYGNDDEVESAKQVEALLAKYPDLKVIVAPTTVGIVAAARAVSDAGRSASVKVTGLGFPNALKEFVGEDGPVPIFGLWSMPDAGYLAYKVADLLVKGEITGATGETFTIPGLNDGKPYTIGPDGVIVLGPVFRFDESNIDQFDY